MGTTSFPLDLTLALWKGVKDTARNNSVDVKKGKQVIFCSSEWPSFNVGWPKGGSFHLKLISKVEDIGFWPCTGHRDQIPYMVTWQGLTDLVDDPRL